MDFHALQQKLFELDPSDPREDLARLQAAAQGSAKSNADFPVKDYVNESIEVAEGSLTLDRNYDIADFAALAGVVTERKQKPADQVRGSEPMPKAKPGRTEHPFRNRLVGEDDDNKDQRIAKLEERVAKLEALIEGKYKSDAQRKAIYAAKAEKKKNEGYDDIKSQLFAKLAEIETRRK